MPERYQVPRDWRAMIEDTHLFLEELDPDWKDRFPDDVMAMDFYIEFMDPKEFLDILKRTQ
jgi:hypothetical protein